MFLENIRSWVLSCVEFINTNVVIVLSSKKMSSIAKHNFFAIFYVTNRLVRNKGILEYVHHSNPISETNYNMETWRMERYAIGFITECLVYFKIEATTLAIAPNLNSLILWTSCYKILLYAYIHAFNTSWVERENKILIKKVISLVL